MSENEKKKSDADSKAPAQKAGTAPAPVKSSALVKKKRPVFFHEELEICALAQRLEVARLLNEGCTYPEIAKQTTEGKKKVSTATISRVKKFLEYGADGYKIVLERLKKTEE